MKISVIMPVYNVENYVEASIQSVLSQSYENLELIIVDDGGNDNSMKICERMADSRTKIISQPNRGLAGARNTGILNSTGYLISLIDSDDLMLPGKLQAHVKHFRNNINLGVSYATSILINEQGKDMGIKQIPKFGKVTPQDVFFGKVILNGSVPVFRRDTLIDCALNNPDQDRLWYFDETLRRTEDVEAWTRIALRSNMDWEAIEGEYTSYRITDTSLSANVQSQLDSWEIACKHIELYAPGFIKLNIDQAKAWELRYLARRCFQIKDPDMGISLIIKALKSYPMIIPLEPKKTILTIMALLAMKILPSKVFDKITKLAGFN